MRIFTLRGWQVVIRNYLLASAAAHLVWEFAQLPLYTLWSNGTRLEQVYAIVHCTGGDVVIAGLSLGFAIIFAGGGWPDRRASWIRVAAVAVLLGLIYTAYSEQMNVAKGTWTYAREMPIVPWLGVGLAPMLQWLLVPPLLLFVLRPRWVKPDQGEGQV